MIKLVLTLGGNNLTVSGLIEYYVEIDKYLFEEISLVIENNGIQKIILKISKENKPLYALKVQFILENVIDLAKIEQITIRMLNNILIEFNIQYAMYTGSPYLIHQSIKGESSSNIPAALEVRRPLDDLLQDEQYIKLQHNLKAIINNVPEQFDSPQVELFRAALSNKDLVTKYMLLYNTLLYCTRKEDKEEQKFVDEFILKYMDDDEEKAEYNETKPKNNGSFSKETVFTKLRNEIGHTRNIPFNDTKDNMKRTLNTFIEIVRSAVARNE